MNKIIPFKKDIVFDSNLSKITSISLEHNLHLTDENLIVGEFIISGEYTLVETSVNVEKFSFNIPFEVYIDDKYNIDKAVIDIDDFYYEIIDNSVLAVNINVLIDRLEEKPIIEEIEEEEEKQEEIIEEELELVRDKGGKMIILNEKKEEKIETLEEDKEVQRSLFESFDSSTETYTTYKVYIIREGDTIDSVLQNYAVSKEELERYNDLNEVNVGDKIIIPAVNEKI